MPLIAEIASDYKLTKERAQYEALLPILTDFFKSSAEPVYYLGNVSFNRANMDAMLLSQHFWMILEFKHYPGMDRVIVTDNQWVALRPGEAVTAQGEVVKGGTDAKTPLEQTQINRSNVAAGVESFLKGRMTRKEICNFVSGIVVFNQELHVERRAVWSDELKLWFAVTTNAGLPDVLRQLLRNRTRTLFTPEELKQLKQALYVQPAVTFNGLSASSREPSPRAAAAGTASPSALSTHDANLFKAAQQAYRKQEFEQALDFLKRMSQRTVEAHILRGACFLAVGKQKTALEIFFQVAPHDPRAHIWISEVYATQFRSSGKEEDYKKAIEEYQFCIQQNIERDNCKAALLELEKLHATYLAGGLATQVQLEKTRLRKTSLHDINQRMTLFFMMLLTGVVFILLQHVGQLFGWQWSARLHFVGAAFYALGALSPLLPEPLVEFCFDFYRRIPLLSVFAPLVSRIPISLIANEPAWKDSQAAPDPRYVRNPALFVLRSMAAYALLFVPVGLLLYYLSQSPALRAVAGWRYFPVPDILGDAAAWFGMFALAYLCFFLVLLARDIYSKEKRYTVFLPWNFFSSTTSHGVSYLLRLSLVLSLMYFFCRDVTLSSADWEQHKRQRAIEKLKEQPEKQPEEQPTQKSGLKGHVSPTETPAAKSQGKAEKQYRWMVVAEVAFREGSDQPLPISLGDKYVGKRVRIQAGISQAEKARGYTMDLATARIRTLSSMLKGAGAEDIETEHLQQESNVGRAVISIWTKE